ncbi:hypothetical protein E2C01_060230 [Portunus trituberculatus]|uniref:Uncharacterized protein n=1 Tax=Portunus trituberculatus TaxID=210409 RepID=A0A5B7H855_PORTR|nr:hypothetical protein [Portunus trituberculatus]
MGSRQLSHFTFQLHLCRPGVFTSRRRQTRLSRTLSGPSRESSELTRDLTLSLDDPVALLRLLPRQNSGGGAVQSSIPDMTDGHLHPTSQKPA